MALELIHLLPAVLSLMEWAIYGSLVVRQGCTGTYHEVRSWYGKHPQLSKADVKAFVPYEACKECAYSLRLSIPRLQRLAIDGEELPDFHGYLFCPNCGLSRSDVMRDTLQSLQDS